MNCALHKNIAYLMKVHGNLSVSELARVTQVPQPTLHHILSGATKNPRNKALQAIAQFFNVSVAQLCGQEEMSSTGLSEYTKTHLGLSSIPVIDWESVKAWPHAFSQEHLNNEILLDAPLSAHSFALVLKNSDMEPLFSSGTTLIFDFARIPKDRDFVLIYFFKEDTITLHRLFIEENQKFIKKILPSGDIQLIKLPENSYKIIAPLHQARMNF